MCITLDEGFQRVITVPCKIEVGTLHKEPAGPLQGGTSDGPVQPSGDSPVSPSHRGTWARGRGGGVERAVGGGGGVERAVGGGG